MLGKVEFRPAALALKPGPRSVLPGGPPQVTDGRVGEGVTGSGVRGSGGGEGIGGGGALRGVHIPPLPHVLTDGVGLIEPGAHPGVIFLEVQDGVRRLDGVLVRAEDEAANQLRRPIRLFPLNVRVKQPYHLLDRSLGVGRDIRAETGAKGLFVDGRLLADGVPAVDQSLVNGTGGESAVCRLVPSG